MKNFITKSHSLLSTASYCVFIPCWTQCLTDNPLILSPFQTPSTQCETSRHTQGHQSPGFREEEVINTVHQCKSSEFYLLMLDIHNLTLMSTSEVRPSLHRTVFQLSVLSGLPGPFLRPDGLVRTIFRVLVAWCIVWTKIWFLDVGLISSGQIWGKFYNFVRFKRPKFWLFASGLCTYYQGSY